MIDVEISGRIGQRTKDGIEPRNTGPDTLDALAERIRAPDNPHQFLRVLATDFAQHESRVFAREGATSEHSRWRPLQPETKERKGSSRILVQTGRLRASVTDASDPGFYSVLRTRSLTLGSSLDYAPYVNKRRPIIRLTKEVVKRWSKAFGDFMANRKH